MRSEGGDKFGTDAPTLVGLLFQKAGELGPEGYIPPGK